MRQWETTTTRTAAIHGPTTALIRGRRQQPYYSYDLGSAWHIVVLDTEVPTSAGSSQYNWLDADLKATTMPYVMAIMHRPLFSANGGTSLVKLYAPLAATEIQH